MTDKITILGAGVTGCAAGRVTGSEVFEAREDPGGICSSYYCRSGDVTSWPNPPDQEVYRFEIGGGHWIFGGDPGVLEWIQRLSPVRRYTRRASVYLPDEELFIPYPIQNNLRMLGRRRAQQIVDELRDRPQDSEPARTLKDWLHQNFGETLCEIFFYPFHEQYTAGLWTEIAPQDAYKSPVNIAQVVAGATQETSAAGYNVEFIYPQQGLNDLCRKMADGVKIHFASRAIAITPAAKRIAFENGSSISYERLLTTLPLNRMAALAQLPLRTRPDPSTAVCVLNIGARKGAKCPSDHWIYIPRSKSGIHRVGFYSNVDSSFLPERVRRAGTHVSIYAERSFRDGMRPSKAELEVFGQRVCEELKSWGWVEQVEVLSPTWIDVAYTWSWPNSVWRTEALAALEEFGISSVGRYGLWTFQGIADSIRDGLRVGQM